MLRAATLVLAVLAVAWLTPTSAAAVPTSPATIPLPDVAVLPGADPWVSLVVNIGSDARPVRPQAVSVIADGARQPATVVPVMSEQLSVGLVVDASEAGRDRLQAWLSGAARFVLEAPAASRTTVVADTTPPVVLAPLQQGPVDLVRALSAVQAHGQRQTSDALTTAVDELAGSPAGPRVVILYTSASDAGGEAAAHLAARLAKAHALLVVVSTAGDTGYWSAAARATGGFLAPAESPAVVPALDQVAAMLRARYLITFAATDRHPTHAFVRVDLQGLAMATDVVVPGTAGVVTDKPPARRDRSWMRIALWAAVAASAILIGAAIRRSRALDRA
jgi:von Willebrand factor type A domain